MNRQRLLWIILSISLLFIVSVIGGLWLFRDPLFRPGGGTTAEQPVAEVNKEPLTQLDAFEITNKNVPVPTMQPDESAKKSNGDKPFEKQDVSIGESHDAYIEPFVRNTETAPKPSITPKKVVQTSTKTPPKVIPKQKQPTIVYWIQTGSYKSKNKAEMCNAVLVEKGLAGRILTKTIAHETFFRVRVGPYANKHEAEKFLAWIRKIDGMEDSYISIEDPVN